MTDRKSLLFYINGKRHEVGAHQYNVMLSDYLRYGIEHTGTKVVCAEGDCGACSVLVGDVHHLDQNGLFQFKPVNSCILFLGLVDGKHIITVEGINKENSYHPIQKSFVENHGAQCGFCTPGFICALSGLFENKTQPTEKNIRNSLTGNLCRCTGYQSIIESALKCEIKPEDQLKNRYSQKEIIEDLKTHLAINIQNESFYSPTDLKKALELKKLKKELKLISGASDLGVLANKFKFQPENLLTLQHIQELNDIKIENDFISIGANVHLHDVQNFIEPLYKEFAELINIFASPQIKNRGTLIGNLANASPIADTIPFLMVVNAELEIMSSSKTRRLNINDFYLGYKKLNLTSEELITRVFIPLPKKNHSIKLYKVSKRKDLDISVVTFAANLQLNENQIQQIQIAFGGVGPIVLRMDEAEKYLTNKEFNKSEIKNAISLIQQKITPLSDVRGSDLYRRDLVNNLMYKFYSDVQGIQ